MAVKVFTFKIVMEVPDHVTEKQAREFIFDALGTHKNLTVQDSDIYGTHNPLADSEVRSVTNMARTKGANHEKE